jgi:hypothetical protein
VVQQNASLVEEATAATESMKEQAHALLQMVARFDIGAAPAVAMAAAAPAPARALATHAAPAAARASRAAIPFRRKAAPLTDAPDLPAPVPVRARGAKVANGDWTEF